MKAIVVHKFGAPDLLQLEEVSAPVLTADTQVKIRVLAAGVNPIDTKLRSKGVLHDQGSPFVPGCDGAGEIMECGVAVKRFKPGDRVWWCHGGLGGMQGNYSEQVVMEQNLPEFMPRSLSFEEAAACPLVLITAWEALYDRANLANGQTVLIHGGAGGVGHVAIQLARLRGARISTTVSDVDKSAFVSALGVEHSIFYRQQDFVEATLDWSNGQGADVILDTVGGKTFLQSIEACAHYGDLVTLLDPGVGLIWTEARNRNLRLSCELMLTPMLRALPQARAHQGEILRTCAKWFDEGKLQIHVSQTLPLADATQAHRMIESGGVQGKLVLIT